MQVVENMKEYILSSRFTGKELYIVNYEYINKLIEMYKIVSRVLLNRFNVLLRKLFGWNVKNRLFWVLVFDFNTDGMSQMGLAQTDSTKYQ